MSGLEWSTILDESGSKPMVSLLANPKLKVSSSKRRIDLQLLTYQTLQQLTA